MVFKFNCFKFLKLGKMSEGRSFLGSAEVDGRVFMIGGCLNEDYSTTEVWDPDTGTFQYIAKEPTGLIQPIINRAKASSYFLIKTL